MWIFGALTAVVIGLVMLTAWIERRGERRDKEYTAEKASFVAKRRVFKEKTDPTGMSINPLNSTTKTHLK